MSLEVLERHPKHASSRPPLLFVHGFWQAAWCWDEHLLQAMADRGYDSYAVSLRGHGGSEGRIRGSSIDDYVADVAAVAATLDDAPVVIGHSMGGFTTQHYLAGGHPAQAGILVSTVPQRGAWKATLKAARRHPGVFARINATLNVGPLVATPELAHEFLFASTFPRSEVARYGERLEDASYRAFLDLLLKRPDVGRISVPTLVVGGDADGFFDMVEWETTAAALGTNLVVLPGAGHEPMLEPSWPELVDVIDEFVTNLAA
ncbi:MAG: alpha/beta fold hydrolase [Acidimicrobiia bacterium]